MPLPSSASHQPVPTIEFYAHFKVNPTLESLKEEPFHTALWTPTLAKELEYQLLLAVLHSVCMLRVEKDNIDILYSVTLFLSPRKAPVPCLLSYLDLKKGRYGWWR